jgi:hypothetical protein
MEPLLHIFVYRKRFLLTHVGNITALENNITELWVRNMVLIIFVQGLLISYDDLLGYGNGLVCHMMVLPNVVAVISKKSLKVCRNASKENWGEERFLGVLCTYL